MSQIESTKMSQTNEDVSHDTKNKWEQAIADLENELRPLKRRVKQLERSRRLIQRQCDEGVPWPGDDSAATGC
jgi:hypothetical protein